MITHIVPLVLKEEREDLRAALDIPFAPDLSQWKTLSLVRVKPTWVQADLYPSLRDHPELASSLLLLKSPEWDRTLAIYPLGTLGVNCNLIVDHGRPTANVRRITSQGEHKAYVVCALSDGRWEERRVVKVAVEEARRLVGGQVKTAHTGDLWDELGVCTWESFGGSSRTPDRPTKQMLLDLVPTHPVKTFLIDDGWQDTRKIILPSGSVKSTLYSFGPWEGMGAPMVDVISSLRAKGMREVGVWITLQGYWYGIDRDSPLRLKYDCRPFRTYDKSQKRGGIHIPLAPGEGTQWVPSPEKAGQFWEDWFWEIKAWGVGFLKVDNQADYDQITGPGSSETQQAMWSGMLSAVDKVWGGMDRVIMCMAHNDRLLNGPGGLDFARPPGNLVFRNSDDFNLQYEYAHPDFVHWNIHNTILTSHLSLIPDFDMFASNPPSTWPLYHALLRCLSPGPMLLSDTPDTQTNMSLISRMTAEDVSGTRKIVKAPTAARALAGRWHWDNLRGDHDGPALMAGTSFPDACGAMIGVWNGRNPSSGAWAKDQLSRQDVGDALDLEGDIKGEYALWSMSFSKENIWKVALVSSDECRGMPLSLDLKPGECEAVVIARTWEVGGEKVAVVGMLDKLIPLTGIRVTLQEDFLTVKCQFASEPLSVLVFEEAPNWSRLYSKLHFDLPRSTFATELTRLRDDLWLVTVTS
ncbi:hypothetical protein M231_07640 [Tremella mesenterica]|uniref:Alpha-galactosidase n=1 Tax=Tremella mesenterica TaxID=5217 RepID=A0A4Q1B8K9_TREME|nr:hypothetical protein M231_07640 [Tremella mesenterica]